LKVDQSITEIDTPLGCKDVEAAEEEEDHTGYEDS
jgi:hypothetical protein